MCLDPSEQRKYNGPFQANLFSLKSSFLSAVYPYTEHFTSSRHTLPTQNRGSQTQRGKLEIARSLLLWSHTSRGSRTVLQT